MFEVTRKVDELTLMPFKNAEFIEVYVMSERMRFAGYDTFILEPDGTISEEFISI